MATNPTLLTMPLAQNGQKNVIPDTQATAGDGLFSQSTGFPAETSLPLGAGGVAPSREDFNGLANLLGGVAFYTQKGFTFNYDATQDYYKGCVVIDPTDGLRYECIADVSANATPPSADTTHWQTYGAVDSFDVGDLKFIAHNNTIPSGWLLCDGSAVSRTTYAELFDAIGTTYGAGNGITTFNLPDMDDMLTDISLGGYPPVVTGSQYNASGTWKNDNTLGKFYTNYYASYNVGRLSNSYIPYGSHNTYANAFDIGETNMGYPTYVDIKKATLTKNKLPMRMLIKYE